MIEEATMIEVPRRIHYLGCKSTGTIKWNIKSKDDGIRNNGYSGAWTQSIFWLDALVHNTNYEPQST